MNTKKRHTVKVRTYNFFVSIIKNTKLTIKIETQELFTVRRVNLI